MDMEDYITEAGIVCLIIFAASFLFNSFGIYVAAVFNLIAGAMVVAFLSDIIHDFRIYITGSWLLGIFISRGLGIIDTFGAVMRAVFFFITFFVFIFLYHRI